MKALIIGGKGKMGRWFAKFLSSKGFEVLINDPAGPLVDYGFVDDFRKALDSNLIVLATPIGKTNDILSELLKHPTEALIFDICSLKESIKETLLKGAKEGKKIVSIHPMFGQAATIEGKNVLVCTCGSDLAVREVKNLFKPSGANLVEIKLEEHDRLMAYVLGLAHAINIVVPKILSETGIPFERFKKLGGPSLATQLKLAESVLAQDPELCYEIQALNPNTKKFFNEFSSSWEELKNLILKKDLSNFIRLVKRGRKYFKTKVV